MAEFATGNREEALDLVQDAMMGLVKSYRDRAPEDWPPLFHRILQSRIRDWYRRSRVRNRLRRWTGFGGADAEAQQGDPVQQAPDPRGLDVLQSLLQEDAVARLQQVLQTLPVRQQQVFLLRGWEGLSVRDTAFAMGCSEGSVKTHYSRALQRLRDMLEDHWP
jgi:RNA polymerase sigma-70 factor (ECF subfamily)